MQQKSRKTAGILALLIGGIGIHKFYLRTWGWGILYIVFVWTYVPLIVSFIEGIVLLCMTDEKFNEKYNREGVSAFDW